MLPTLPVMLKYWYTLDRESQPFQQKLQQLYFIYLCVLLKSYDQGAEGIQQMIQQILLALAELILDFERQMIKIHIFFKWTQQR